MINILIIAGAAMIQGDDAAPHQAIRLALDPEARILEAHVASEVPIAEATRTLSFLIHDDLEIESLTGSGVAGHSRERSMEFPGIGESTISLVTVEFTAPLEPGDSATLDWRYAGWIDTERILLGAGAGRPDWVELDVGSVWHPIEASLSRTSTFEVDVSAPEGYEIYGAGAGEEAGGRTRYVITEPVISATVIAAPKGVLQVETATPQVTLAMVEGAPEAGVLAESLQNAVVRMEAMLGPVERAGVLTLILPPEDRARDGEAYARSNLIVMPSGMEPGPARLRVAAHELAHLWWHHAHSQTEDNFLNEAFAEYYAWLAVEAEHGPDTAEEFRSEAREAALGAGPLRGGGPPFPVYTRGPLVLAELHDRLGDESFHALAREAAGRPVRTLDDFLALAGEMAGEEHAAWLGAELDAEM